MKHTFEIGKKSTVKLTIKLSAEEWNDAINVAYEKTKGKYSIPGFRKGKVPKKVLENAYGAGVFYEEAINYAFPKYYEEVLTIGNLQYSWHGCLCTEEFRDDLSVHPGSYATGLGRTIGKTIGCRG